MFFEHILLYIPLPSIFPLPPFHVHTRLFMTLSSGQKNGGKSRLFGCCHCLSRYKVRSDRHPCHDRRCSGGDRGRMSLSLLLSAPFSEASEHRPNNSGANRQRRVTQPNVMDLNHWRDLSRAGSVCMCIGQVPKRR